MSARSGEADTSTEDEQQKACGSKIHVSIAYPGLALTMIGQDGAMMAQDGAQMGQDGAKMAQDGASGLLWLLLGLLALGLGVLALALII